MIKIEHLKKEYANVTPLKDVSVEIHEGDVISVIGPSGTGKSTLMRAMLGLVRPARGSIIYGDGLTRERIGYLPQQTAAQRDFPASVEEVVLSGCVNRMGRRFFYNRSDREKAEANMMLLDVTQLRRKSYRTLSGGQQQRTLLARALCATDAILLLDEPVTGLDPTAASEFYDVIRDLNRKHGVAVVMVSHDLGGAMRDANKVLVMNRGVDFFGGVDDYRAGLSERAVATRG
jgi:zinc transport system ATP-binding protein